MAAGLGIAKAIVRNRILYDSKEQLRIMQMMMMMIRIFLRMTRWLRRAA
jgi:hypothetical protein